MPFKQGKRPTVTIDAEEHRAFRKDLERAGYRPHAKPRVARDGEIGAWVVPIAGGRQVHVQEVRRGDGDVDVYAHTEPAGVGPKHAVSAVADRASFSGGARVLREDLRRAGWEFDE